MGIYSRIVLPRLLDMAMSLPELGSHRRQLLASVTGEVLEIGFGTGVNLTYYPKHVKKLTAVDSNAGMTGIAKKRMRARGIDVDHHVLNAERLPFEDARFDSVVSTWTLCSVKDIGAVLKEIQRVLKPDGKLCFLEHGISPDKSVRRLQKLLNFPNSAVAGGCQLTRNMSELIADAGFSMESLTTFYIEKAPKTHGFMYQGMARKKS